MSLVQNSTQSIKCDSWEMFQLDPTKSPFLPQSDLTAKANTALELSNLEFFAQQGLFPAEQCFPQPSCYPESSSSQEQASTSDYSGTQSNVMKAIRDDMDRVITSVWRLRHDTETRIMKLEHEAIQASEAAISLRKDIDAIEGWMQQITAYIHAAGTPANLDPPAAQPTFERQEQTLPSVEQD